MNKSIDLSLQDQEISARSKQDGVLLILLFSTFRLPVLFDGNLGVILNIAVVLAIGLLIALRLPKDLVIRNISKRYLYLIIFFVIWGQVAELRTLLNGHRDATFVLKIIFWQWLIILLALGMVSRLRNKQELELLLRSLIIGAGLYLIINLVLAFFGVKSADHQAVYAYDLKGAILNAMGFDILLFEFPLASSVKGIAPLCLFIALVSSRFFGKFGLQGGRIPPSTLLALISIFMIIVIDSRMAVATFLVVSLAAIILNRIIIYRGAILLVLITPFLPFVIVFLAGLAQDAGIFSFVGKSAYDNISTLSNRTIFWADAANVILRFDVNTLLGFGSHGEVESGISERTGYVFAARLDHINHSLHNTTLQMIVDRGMIGLLLFVALIITLLKRLFKGGNLGVRLALGLIGVFLMGQTESLFSITPVDVSTLFLFLYVFASSTHLNTVRKD